MRLACVQVGHVHRLISIHAPQWGATERPAVTRHEQVISIHAPQWGATGCRSCVRVGCCNFNPRTPVGCDTRIRLLTLLVVLISIHAPQWGATSVAQWALNAAIFQSTHPSGVRPTSNQPPSRRNHISIHAPQWGATNLTITQSSISAISIHAPQWGATYISITEISSIIEFQSTHPSGVRLVEPVFPLFAVEISIHAPQWGATGTDYEQSNVRDISIHAPQWGATYRETSLRFADVISIHAPQWGATKRAVIHRTNITFQSTHPSGVRRAADTVHQSRVISIHAPQWGATTRKP